MINSISLWKVSSSSYKSTKIKLDESYNNIHNKKSGNHNELHVACLYNLPSYRCGILGWLFSFFCDYLPKTYLVAYCFRSLRWTDDAQLLSKSVSWVNRMVPILNFGTWNRKQHFLNYNKSNSIFKYGGENNKSMSTMFNFFKTPFYDSGCAILSNIPAYASDFVPFDSLVNKNRGILWHYYDDFQVLVMTLSTDHGGASVIEKTMEIQKDITSKFICKTTYIIADFKREIIFDTNIMNTLSYKFKIRSIEGEKPTSYIIHNYIYDNLYQQDNIFKVKNVVVTSPIKFIEMIHLTKQPDIVSVAAAVAIAEAIPTTTTTEEEMEDIEAARPPSPVDDDKTKEQIKPEEEEAEEKTTSTFPYIIFNYFSTKTTPPMTTPTTTPPSKSPPLQSPKSDDGWSKV